MIINMIKRYIANLNEKDYIKLKREVMNAIRSHIANLNDKAYIELKSEVMREIEIEDKRRGLHNE